MTTAAYRLPQPDFTPAPGWQNVTAATPQRAESDARSLHLLTQDHLTLQMDQRGPHPNHSACVSSNKTMGDILELQSQLCQFITGGRWAPDWIRQSRQHLPEELSQATRPTLETIDVCHRPLVFSMLINAWVEHAIQTPSHDFAGPVMDVPFATARDDWKRLSNRLRDEPEYPAAFRGNYLGFEPPPAPDGHPRTPNWHHVWTDVAYHPELGYRAARHILRINYAGKQDLAKRLRENPEPPSRNNHVVSRRELTLQDILDNQEPYPVDQDEAVHAAHQRLQERLDAANPRELDQLARVAKAAIENAPDIEHRATDECCHLAYRALLNAAAE